MVSVHQYILSFCSRHDFIAHIIGNRRLDSPEYVDVTTDSTRIRELRNSEGNNPRTPKNSVTSLKFFNSTFDDLQAGFSRVGPRHGHTHHAGVCDQLAHMFVQVSEP